MTDITSKQLYDEIIKSRNEIKRTIEASEARLLYKIEEGKRRIEQLEQENSELKGEIEALKRDTKKNNIVIFGIKHQAGEVTLDFLQQNLKDLLDINLERSDVNDFYTLGKSKDSPIKLELTTYIKKKNILQERHKLKGTKVYINNDLTPIQREENKQLRGFLNLAFNDSKTKTAYIRGNQLYINGVGRTLEELLKVDDLEEENCDKANSAPETPTHLNLQVSPEHEIAPTASTSKDNPLQKIGTPRTGTIKKSIISKSYATRNRLK